MATITRTYTFTDGSIAYGSQVESEVSNIVTTWNNHDGGTSTWTNVKATSSVITNLDLGSSGVAGSLDVFPSTSSTGKITLSATANSGDTTTTITNAAQGGARTYTIPEAGASASFVMTQGTQTISGTKTFDGQLIGKGTATNDSAAAGYIGQYIESVVTAQAGPTTNQWGDVTSISLTAGDWDVTFCADQNITGTSTTALRAGIGTVTGNDGTGMTQGTNMAQITPNGIDINRYHQAVPSFRVSLTGTTTYYAKHFFLYTGGSPTTAGRISARRVR